MASKRTRKPAKTKASKKAASKKAAPKPKKAQKKPQAKHAVSRVDLFAIEYLKDLNGRQAAIRAGYSPASARQTASELLATAEVQAKVQAAMDERATRTGIEGDDVIKRLWSIATADPRELIELHRSCCRFCWGKQHYYQWTPQELRQAKSDYAREVAAASADQLKLLRAPEETGGAGFDPRRDPNPDCPECFGEGTERIIPKDTRDLSAEARLLYAGVKTTQHGLEIKMHDQTGMLVNVGKHLGLFKEKVELTGKNGSPVKVEHLGAILDEISGSGTGLPGDGTKG